MPEKRTEMLFVVRLWNEGGDETAPWRGYVEYVASGRRFYFNELADLSDFITLCLGRRNGRP